MTDAIQDAMDEKVSILLVDDQPGNLVSLRAVLERPDYDLVLAHDGEEALRLVLKHDFAVILLDVAMPDMDGFEVASILKQRPSYRTVPIIFVTASVQHIEWIFKGYSVGAVDFLHKPLDPQQVRAKVAVFVELYRQKRQIERQAERLRIQQKREQEIEIERLHFQHERRLRNLAEAIPHVVWVAAADGTFEYVNRQWTQVTGHCDRVAKGLGWLDAVHPDDAPSLRAGWTESIRGGSPFEFEFRLRYSDGTFRWQQGRALPYRNGSPNIIGWFGTFTDADEEKRARAELLAAIRMRDEFLAVASHELRTPLTALRLRVEKLRRGLREGLEPERIAENVEHAARQLDRLNDLVSRTLDVSRLATGSMQLQLEELDAAHLVREVVARLADEATRAGCTVDVAGDEVVRGTWDRVRFEQLVTNLLSNAFKYGAGKPVSVSVTAGSTGEARVEVCDQGIGMSADDIERIFGRFERAVPVTNYGGLGLGLYVVAQIVEAHGGRIEVRSEPGRGSTFLVTLPSAEDERVKHGARAS